MKRTGIFLGAAILAVVFISGCGKSGAKPETKTADSTPDKGPVASPAKDRPALFTAKTRSLVASGDVPLLEQLNRENTRVVAAAAPCLVRISSQVQIDPHSQLLGLPFHFPGLPHGVKTTVPSYGSGVIISADGYIVTNYHVVREGKEVVVQLRDKRSLPARVVASDKESDLAVLKIDATGLAAMPWGDSDKVVVGELVFALGNPFNLDTSVSKGIISGMGRNLPDTAESSGGEVRPVYEDYLQTDAAINVGNSGGALINIHGELIGINAAIASFTQGSEGVGFSIPSNLVRNTVEQLIRQGHLIRGYLGVRLPAKIDDGVSELLGLDSNRGALLAGIQRKSPAELAKLKPVDCIVEIDGHRIDSLPQFRLIVAQIPVGKEIVVNYIRGGAPHSATVKIGESPKESDPADPGLPADTGAAPPVASLPQGNHVLTGVQVADLNDKSRHDFGVDDFVNAGVVVTGVQEGSPADIKGLLRGDVIEVACAQRGSVLPLVHATDFTGLTKGLKADQTVALLVHHGKLSQGADRSSTFLYLAPAAK